MTVPLPRSLDSLICRRRYQRACIFFIFDYCPGSRFLAPTLLEFRDGTVPEYRRFLTKSFLLPVRSKEWQQVAMTSSTSVSFRSSHFLSGTSGYVYLGQNEQRGREIWLGEKRAKRKEW